MPEFSATVVQLFQKRAAKEQGGLLSGKDPSAFNPDDPIRLWIIQVGVIVSTASLLALGLRKMRQPKVIAEVLGGILLGPTAFGRIPGFSQHIFPEQSKPYLSLVANIGLCLFLFLVGLEIDAGVVKRNARLSATIGIAGMVVPFGFGAALSYPIYNNFADPDVKFTYFMLFAGVAFSITAFPVLCRILTELKLLDTTVGIVVLSAGVANDIVGWTLLALAVALVNAGSGLTAVYILLVCVGWTLFLLIGVKPVLAWLARYTGSIENGPTMFFMTITILLVFGSAFFTDIIGVHAIFGAFLAGIIVPREGNMAIHLTEKLEDMVSIIFLPLYFTLSGLSTDLGLLNDGITWGFTIAICATAFVGKFGACTLAAKYTAGFSWRESSAIGSLMSCKGLVELIVLNVGLSAGILSQKVFSMFVLEALVLTFATTPLVTYFYPLEQRTRVDATGPNFNNVTDGAEQGRHSQQRTFAGDGVSKKRFTFVLDKLDHMPGMMIMAQLIQPTIADPMALADTASSSSGSKLADKTKAILGPAIEALRLIELSDRVSAVMKSSASDSLLHSDPLLAVFRMFGHLNDIVISTALAIVPYDDLSQSVVEHAGNNGSEMIMMPWLPPHSHGTALADAPEAAMTPRAQMGNPFEMLFKTATATDSTASAIHSHFVRGVFAGARTDVAVFVDQMPPTAQTGSLQHIVLPFFGGPDDRLALDFVVQLCENPKITATLLKITKRDVDDDGLAQVPTAHIGDEKDGHNALETVNAFPDTVYGYATTETRMQSETADNIAWARYAQPSATATYPSVDALQRMEFRDMASPVPLHAMLTTTHELIEAKAGKRVLVIAGRSRRLAAENHSVEIKTLIAEHGSISSDVRKTIGDVASAFVVTRCASGVIVVQAAMRDE